MEYDNPSFPLPLPEAVTVAELTGFGSGSTYEVSARNLRRVPASGEDAASAAGEGNR